MLANVRQTLADQLRTNGVKVTKRQVYDHPADVVKLPAVVVQNGDPMITTDTMDVSGRYRWALEVVCFAQRSKTDTAVGAVEDMVLAVASAVRIQGSQFRFVDASAPETVEVNGLNATAATVTIEAIMT